MSFTLFVKCIDKCWCHMEGNISKLLFRLVISDPLSTAISTYQCIYQNLYTFNLLKKWSMFFLKI